MRQKIIRSVQISRDWVQIGLSASRDWYVGLSRGQRIGAYLLAFFVLVVVIAVVFFAVSRH